jgi:hypothetical protein
MSLPLDKVASFAHDLWRIFHFNLLSLSGLLHKPPDVELCYGPHALGENAGS